MQIFVINLDDQAGRLAAMGERLGRFGLDWQRMPAVDLRGEKGRALLGAPGHPVIADLTASETGCLLSHRACWQRLVDSGEGHALVFEDDVVLSSGFGDLMADTSWLTPDLHLVKLERFNHPVFLEKGGRALAGGFSLRKTARNHTGAAAYIISAPCAREILARFPAVHSPTDWLLFRDVFRRQVFQVDPAPCVQEHVLEAGPGTRVWAATGDIQRSHGRTLFPRRALTKVMSRLADSARIAAHGMVQRDIPFDPR